MSERQKDCDRETEKEKNRKREEKKQKKRRKKTERERAIAPCSDNSTGTQDWWCARTHGQQQISSWGSLCKHLRLD